MPDSFILALSTYGSFLLIIVTLVFLVSQLKKDNSIMDIAYGPTFLLAGLASTLSLENGSPLSITILIALALWSIRLGGRIYRKNHGSPEDARYAAWRSLWMKKGTLYFMLRSYLQINLLQGLIILVVSLPFIIGLAFGTDTSTYATSWLTMLGFIIFAAGLTIESIADYQLDQFIARKKAGTEPANLMTSGLFRYSRRPNYFGESLIWWGLAIAVLPLPFGSIALLSPLVITYVVTRITGPMLENIFISKYGDEYREYMRKTSYFIPLPPKE